MKLVAYGFAALVALCLIPACAIDRRDEYLEARVSRLVDQTTKSEGAARRAFDELESLGDQVVPYLVGHLGDLRLLATRTISLENKASDAFEGVRHYGPRTVHDALAAILSQITGQSFVIVYNGATHQEREENRIKWVEWCLSALPAQADICKGG